jgi:hypothetical protein
VDSSCSDSYYSKQEKIYHNSGGTSLADLREASNEKNLYLYFFRHIIGITLSCLSLWHIGRVNWMCVEGLFGKVSVEKLMLDPESEEYDYHDMRKELKDWERYCQYALDVRRIYAVEVFGITYSATYSKLSIYGISLLIWPIMAKKIANVL